MDSSEVSSDNNKEKKESNFKYSASALTLFFLSIAIIFLFLLLTGALDTNQYMTLLLTDAFLFVSSLSLILSFKQLNISKLQEKSARESILASRDSIKSAVAPRLIFRKRPANDYWLDPYGKQASWEPGVGIYIENFGLGPALNIRFSVKAFGELHEQSCVVEFIRMPAMTIYTIPSKQFPQLSVNKLNHESIIIESLEYDDIRNPPNHYRDAEPTILELEDDDFDEPARPP